MTEEVKAGRRRHWSTWITCAVLLVTAAVLAFPRVIGSDDEPDYLESIVFAALAVVFLTTGTRRNP